MAWWCEMIAIRRSNGAAGLVEYLLFLTILLTINCKQHFLEK